MRRVVAVAAAVGAAAGAARGDVLPADLAVSLAAPQSAEAGAIVAVSVTVENRGPGAAREPAVTVVLPPGVRSRASSCTGTTTVVCRIAALGAGARATTSVPVRSDGFGSRTFTATVSSDATDANDTNDSASVEIRFYVVNFRGLRAGVARAGRRFVYSATLVRTDAGVAMHPRWVRCGASIARTPAAARGPQLRTTHAVAGGRVTCAVAVPRSSRGRYFVGGLFAHATGDFTAKLVFLRRVR